MSGRGERKGFGRRGDREGVEKIGQKGSGGNMMRGGWERREGEEMG